MDCDPETLARESNCIFCLGEEAADAIYTYLLCQWVNGN